MGYNQGTGDPTYTGNNPEDLPRGLKIDTTTSAYGDAGAGRPVPKFLNDRKRKKVELYKERKENMFSKGGFCKGAGAAIKGTKFEGVF